MNLTHLMHLCAATHAIIGISILTILLRLPHRPEINRTIKYTLLLAHLTLSAYLYHRSPDPAAIADMLIGATILNCITALNFLLAARKYYPASH